MVQLLKTDGNLLTQPVEKAILETPRHIYVPQKIRHLAYEDAPLPIGGGQTISAPHMVAIMCDALRLKPGEKVLEIGAGSGYNAAVMSRIVGETGKIYSVERIESVAKNAVSNLREDGRTNVKVVVGDGTLGLPDYAPYDAIAVACASPEVPETFLDQIREGGRILIPIGRMPSELVLAIKKGGKILKNSLGGCAFVPMLGEFGFRN